MVKLNLIVFFLVLELIIGERALLVNGEDNTSSAIVEKARFALIPGDFIIGALFPLHHQPPANNKRRTTNNNNQISCGEIRELYGIQRVEVALQTLDQINADHSILPNLTLGIEIRDECWYAPIALQQSIELIRDNITPATARMDLSTNFDSNKCPHTDNSSAAKMANLSRGSLIGVIGPGASSVALQVQNLLQLFQVSQVGYSATSRDLSDKSRFNYFLRVVPSDYHQAHVILDIVRYFGWTYVSVVHTDENYGISGGQAFRELSEKTDICVAQEDSVLSNAPDEAFDRVIRNLRKDTNANVVVCFCEGLTVRGLLLAMRRLNLENEFLFIGSDGWADRTDVTAGLETEAWGGISIRIHSPYVQSFDKYYWSLRPSTNHRNPWFREFWETRFNCSLTDPMHLCSDNKTLSSNYRQDSKLSFVIKAIYSLAHALHNLQEDICGPGNGMTGTCPGLLPFNGSLFKSYLLNVSFDYDEDLVKFDENGDPPGRYDIMNFQRLPDGSFDYVQVGSWNNRSLTWIPRNLIQFGGVNNGSLPRSVCSENCSVGHYKNIQQGGKDKRCCWVCVPCPFGEVQDIGGDHCKPCPLGFVPDDQKLFCVLLPIEFTQWFHTPALVALAFAAVGLVTTLFTFVAFLRHYNTPVVKSSTRELCFIILIGMTNAHASIVSIVAKPSDFTCLLNRILPGASFAMIYGALMTKTNRIARILAGTRAKRLSTRKPSCVSVMAQLSITSFVLVFQVVIAFILLHFYPCHTTFEYQATRTILLCNETVQSVAGSLGLDFLLILLCTLYAIKTRNVPENFNEAKFIGFAMYTTCVIWIAFVAIYFGTDKKVVTLALCVSFSALVIWVFLFAPKLYVILVRPERNNRALFVTCKDIRCHFGGGASRVSSVGLDKVIVSNSWKNKLDSSQDQGIVQELMPKKRTLSCQTEDEQNEEFLTHRQQLLLPIESSYLAASIKHERSSSNVASILERDCCETESCHIKTITITLPTENAKL